MYAITSLLDDPTDELVRGLWDELKDELGIRTVVDFLPHPHVTYHVAESYNIDRLRAALDELATEVAPFDMLISGVGVFTHPQQVLYLPVTRGPLLSALHQQVWEAVETAAQNPSDLYSATRWMPHITLAQHDIDIASLAEAMQIVGGRDLTRTVHIDNLMVLATSGEDQTGEIYKVTLNGPR